MRRKRSRRSIARLARKGNVGGLWQVLDSRDLVKDRDGVLVDLAVPARVQATEALGQIDDHRAAAAAAARALEDGDSRVRLCAVRALEQLDPEGDRDADLAEALVRWESDEQSPERTAAVERLRGRSSPEPVTALVDALVRAGPGREIKPADEQAIRALADGHDPELQGLCERLTGELATGADPRIDRILAALGEPAVDPLVDALSGPAVLRAAGVLSDLRSARAVEPLVTLVSAGDPELRAAAARALGAIRDPQAAEALLRASLDTEATVRDAAQGALEGLGMAGVLAGLAAFVGPLVGRIEQLEAAQREVRALPQSPGPAHAVDHPDRPGLKALRRALGR